MPKTVAACKEAAAKCRDSAYGSWLAKQVKKSAATADRAEAIADHAAALLKADPAPSEADQAAARDCLRLALEARRFADLTRQDREKPATRPHHGLGR